MGVRGRCCITPAGRQRIEAGLRRYVEERRATEPSFDERVDRSAGPGACWPWTGPRHSAGYGLFRRQYAHRLALESALGRPLGSGMEACHSCDNPPCCNPAHLFEGTHQDNVRDMAAKGRHRRFRQWDCPDCGRPQEGVTNGFRARCPDCAATAKRMAFRRWWLKRQVRAECGTDEP